MIKAILFDFDGTIVDSLKHHFDTFKKTAAFFGKDFTDEEIVKKALYPTEDQAKIFEEKGVDIDEFWKLQNENLTEAFANLQMHQHLEGVLKSLRSQGLKFAILSFAPRESILRELKKFGIEDCFEVVLGWGDVEKPKPDPAIALKALEKMSIKKEEAVLIGDTHFDILTGKNAGILTGLFVPENNRLYADIDLYRSTNPDFEFQNYLELQGEIKRLQTLK